MKTEPCRKTGLGLNTVSVCLIICGKEGNPPQTLFLVIFPTFSSGKCLCVVGTVPGTERCKLSTNEHWWSPRAPRLSVQAQGALQTLLPARANCVLTRCSKELITMEKDMLAPEESLVLGKSLFFGKLIKRKKKKSRNRIIITSKSWLELQKMDEGAQTTVGMQKCL